MDDSCVPKELINTRHGGDAETRAAVIRATDQRKILQMRRLTGTTSQQKSSRQREKKKEVLCTFETQTKGGTSSRYYKSCSSEVHMKEPQTSPEASLRNERELTIKEPDTFTRAGHMTFVLVTSASGDNEASAPCLRLQLFSAFSPCKNKVFSDHEDWHLRAQKIWLLLLVDWSSVELVTSLWLSIPNPMAFSSPLPSSFLALTCLLLAALMGYRGVL
uniref:Uncharacterized protein n=1 Tax=Knipowitschia caucasica TaxID=637954 RepID=A0AAV2KDI0_KNICA